MPTGSVQPARGGRLTDTIDALQDPVRVGVKTAHALSTFEQLGQAGVGGSPAPRNSASRLQGVAPRPLALALGKSWGSSSSTSRPGARQRSKPCSTASSTRCRCRASVAGVVPESPHGLHTAGLLLRQRFSQGGELGQQITHAATRHQLGDGLAAAGNHHGLPGFHRIQQAGEPRLGIRHRQMQGVTGPQAEARIPERLGRLACC